MDDDAPRPLGTYIVEWSTDTPGWTHIERDGTHYFIPDKQDNASHPDEPADWTGWTELGATTDGSAWTRSTTD